MLTIEVNGTQYKDALNIRVSRSMYNFCGFFEATATASPENVLPVKTGDSVRIFADGNQILDGYIEQLEVNYDSQSHDIYIAGRDKTADVFDSSVVGEKVYKGPNSLVSITKSVLAGNGISGINVIDASLSESQDFANGESIEAEVGQKIFNFLEPYARKLQFVFTTNEDGNIIFYRGGAENSGLILKRGENIKSASLRKKTDKVYNKYVARSQLDPLANQGESADAITSQTGQTAIDPSVRSSRQIEFNTEEEMNNSISFNRAEFEANIRRANSVNYSCVIQGHNQNGKEFRVNTLAFVEDDFCGINTNLLIHSVEYIYSLGSGSTTKLDMTYKDAFTLQAQQQARDAARQLVADNF